jgi:signal transduction histidine kinase
MPRGGQLEVRAGRQPQDSGTVAEIAIRDSGAGIPPDAREKIFQPFFTTKAMGTGLGLAVVKRIVEGHGGTIVLADSVAGAEFHLRLPIDA